jgi:hypothetical protein
MEALVALLKAQAVAGRAYDAFSVTMAQVLELHGESSSLVLDN